MRFRHTKCTHFVPYTSENDENRHREFVLISTGNITYKSSIQGQRTPTRTTIRENVSGQRH